ncbi:MAG: translation initiation factor IF-2 [Actinobacteria bacterium]|nr:MAG: translation initiation factor IF-2 [Actinomycetota bacterium]
MSKRVHEVAKELGVSSKDLMKLLNRVGVEVKSHAAAIDDDVVARLKGAAKKQSEAKAKPMAPPVKKGPELRRDGGPRHGRRRERHERGAPAAVTATVEVPEKKAEEAVAKEKRPLKLVEGATVKEFADAIAKPPTEIIRRVMALGEMVTINQPLSEEALNVLGEEMGYEIELHVPEEELAEVITDKPEDLKPRPPVVTIMGHVDHGKTSLLDAIRKSDIISGEAGGITQHIGAYQISHDGKGITFIDTPGHEAFTAMRARGAKVTDVAVLVVAADDGVMPQTVEAIDHARAAEVPIVVAVNKVDKPDADPEKVRREMVDHGVIPEEWGGDTVFVDVSAKQKSGIDSVLDMILLVSELQELRANPNAPARGVAIEAKLDKGRGPVATVLVQRGTLHVGDAIVAGLSFGKVRALVDDRGKDMLEAGPGQPVEVVGLSTVPQAGDEVVVHPDERSARHVAEERALKRRLLEHQRPSHVTLDDLFEKIKEGEIQDLNLVVKADTQGSIEALRDAVNKLDQSEVRINILHTGIGGISKADVMLASASNAIIIGFNVRPDPIAKTMAEKESVDMRTYRVIYQLIDDINAARVGMLAPEYKEEELGRLEVRQVFKVPKIGAVAGSYVTEGEVTRDAQARVVRDGTIIFEGGIHSLRRFKEDVKEVKAGYDCGVTIEDFQDVKEGDVIEVFRTVEVKRTE